MLKPIRSAEIAEAKTQLLKAKIEYAKAEVQLLNTNLEHAKAHVQRLSTEIEHVKAETPPLQTKIKHAEAKLQQLNTKIEQAEAEVKPLNDILKKIKNLTTAKKKLTDCVKNLKIQKTSSDPSNKASFDTFDTLIIECAQEIKATDEKIKECETPFLELYEKCKPQLLKLFKNSIDPVEKQSPVVNEPTQKQDSHLLVIQEKRASVLEFELTEKMIQNQEMLSNTAYGNTVTPKKAVFFQTATSNLNEQSNKAVQFQSSLSKD